MSFGPTMGAPVVPTTNASAKPLTLELTTDASAKSLPAHALSTPTRALISRDKVSTPFGSMYVDLLLDAAARPIGLRVWSPGKCENTQLDVVLESISRAADELIREAARP